MSTQKTKTRRLLREVKQEENSDEESADASVETRRKRQKLETKPTKPTPSNQKDDESEEEDNDEPEQPVKATKAPEKVKVTPSASSKKEIRASFVMKLFDRSVNLSKFNINTPLYSICRDWMRNAPRAKVKKGKKNEEEEFHERRSVPEIFSMVRNGIVAEIKFLPPVNDLSISKIPELMEFQKDLDKSKINLRYKLDCPLVPKEDLMRRHMVRWKLIRENWHAHAKDYGTQYAESFELIDGIYRKTF